MKIQVLNSSKFKIFLNKSDLDENHISVHSFLSGSINSQKFIQAIIEIAYEDFGLKINNNKFIYEIFCFDFSNFIIIISSNKEIYPFPQSNSIRETSITNNLNFKFNNNKLLESKNLLFFFNDFEEFLTFSEYIKNSIKLKNINSSLYEYNHIFLLEIITSDLLINELKAFLSITSEYNLKSLSSNLTLIRFKEFAKTIYSKNALNL